MAPDRLSISVIEERRLGGVRRAILDDRDVPCGAPPECRDGQIVPAITVEICSLDVGHARPVVQPQGRAEFAFAQAAQPDHGPFLVIGRIERAHVADEHVLDAVAIHVDVCRVRRVRDAGDDRQRRPCRGSPREDNTLTHVGAQHVEATVTVEVHQGHVRDRRLSRHVRHRQAVSHEPDRRLGRIRPGVRRRQPLGRAGHIVGQDLGEVWRQLHGLVDRLRSAYRRQPVLADERHPDELVAPAVAGKDLRGRERMAPAARRARHLFVRLAGGLNLALEREEADPAERGSDPHATVWLAAKS